jgi:hypothetical protein
MFPISVGKEPPNMVFLIEKYSVKSNKKQIEKSMIRFEIQGVYLSCTFNVMKTYLIAEDPVRKKIKDHP